MHQRWLFAYSYINASTDIGEVVDWIKSKFVVAKEGDLAVLHNRNKMVNAFATTEWVAGSGEAIISRSVTSCAGMTAYLVLLAQTRVGFLSGGRGKSFHQLTPQEQAAQKEEAFARATVALTRAQQICFIMGPLDMRGLVGAATIMGCLKYGGQPQGCEGYTSWWWTCTERMADRVLRLLSDIQVDRCADECWNTLPIPWKRNQEAYQLRYVFGYAMDGSDLPCYILWPTRTVEQSFWCIDAWKGDWVGLDKCSYMAPVGVEHFFDAFCFDPQRPWRAAACQALGIPSSHVSEDTHLEQVHENKFSLTPRRIPVERKTSADKRGVDQDMVAREESGSDAESGWSGVNVVQSICQVTKSFIGCVKSVLAGLSKQIDRLLEGYCFQNLATNRDPEAHNGRVIQTATHLTWILAEYLADTIAWLMRSILDHVSKILFDNDTQPLLTPKFWILPLYRELLNSARRIRPSASSERARGCTGLVKLAGRRWWLRGYLAGRPRQGGHSIHSVVSLLHGAHPWHQHRQGAAGSSGAMEDTDSTEVVYKIRQWSLPGAAIVPVLNVSSRVFWLELDDKALLDSYAVLQEGILCDVFSQKCSAAWQGARGFRTDLQQRAAQASGQASVDGGQAAWRVLADRMYTKAPSVKSKEELDALLFDRAARRNRTDPYEEKSYRGAAIKEVQAWWKQCKDWMAHFKEQSEPFVFDFKNLLKALSGKEAEAQSEVDAFMENCAKRWQTREGTYQLKRRRLKPDVRDTPEDPSADVDMADI
eukprot:symbB.v1.2.041566.t1/scaffold8358.1/size6671/1